MSSLLPTVRVLHVDDEPALADMAATYIEQEDDRFNVETATSAGEGLKLLANNSFDCIVSDYEMPGQDGIEFLETVREAHPDLPFILYTGKGSEEVASEAISAGVTEYLQKDTGTSQYTVLVNRMQNAVEKYHTQQELINREKRLALLFEQSPLGLLEYDVSDNELTISRINEQAERILGYPEKDLRGETWEKLVTEDSYDDVGKVADALVTGEGGQHSIDENIRKDGEMIICEWHNRVVTDDDNKVVTVISQFQDITGRRERKQELEYYSQLVTDLPVGVFRTTTDGEILSVNQRTVEIFAADSPADLRAVGLEDLFARPEDYSQLHERLKREATIENEHVQVTTVTGKPRYCEITLKTTQEANTQYVTGIVQDVTDGREVKEELKQVETIANALNDAVYVVDEHGQFEYVNDEFTELTGYDRETILGSTPALIKSEAAMEDAEDHLGQLLSDEGPDTAAFEVTIQPRDSNPIVCEDQMGVLPYEGNQFNGSVGVLRDITDRKQQEQRLRRERDRLDEFAGVVSHDLRNPLNVAASSVQLAAQECDSPHLGRAERAHGRMETLIEDLLTLARGGDQVESPDPAVLRELAESAWENVATSAAQVRVTTDADRTLLADQSRLSQLFENLYRNAVEHGGEDVMVRIGELVERDGLYIEDNGPGIPAADREQIFEAGFSTADDGTGFGLSIVKQVVEAHGWEIQATTGSDGGARFEITGVEFVE